MSFRKVKPTKSNLIKLEKKIKFASKGKQYLEFKREKLIKEIKKIWPKYIEKREKVLTLFKKSLLKLNRSYMDMGKKQFEIISMISKIQFEPTIKLQFKKKIGGYITKLDYNSHNEGSLPPFAFNDTSQHIDELMVNLRTLFLQIIGLAELENKMIKYAFNFQKINRRINGLKNIIIPKLEVDIQKIKVMLEELERENFIRLKKTKDIINDNKIFSM